MRASSLLTLLFIAAEFIVAEVHGIECKDPELKINTKKPDKLESPFRMQCIDGYLRQAGTSNLYRCIYDNEKKAYIWKNDPSLICIPDPSKPAPSIATYTQAHTPVPNLTLSTSSTSSTVTTYCTATEKTKSASTTTGQTALTTTATTHTVATTTGTSLYRTTTKEETTTNRIILSSSTTLTSREIPTTVSPQFSQSSISTTTTTTTTTTTSITTTTTRDKNGRNLGSISETTQGKIAAGALLVLIAVAAAGFLIWCRRSRQREERAEIEMNMHQEPLMPCSYSSDSVQSPSCSSVVVQHAESVKAVNS